MGLRVMPWCTAVNNEVQEEVSMKSSTLKLVGGWFMTHGLCS